MGDTHIPRYQELDVWKVSMELATNIYRLTASLPADERFGLIAQMRRAAVSVPSNVAEGHGRGSAGEARQFARIAQGSLSELETQVMLTRSLYDLAGTEGSLELVNRVRRMLMKLHESLREAPVEYDVQEIGCRMSDIE